MNDLLVVLDGDSPRGNERLGGKWDREIESVLSSMASSEHDRDLLSSLTKRRAWVLLGWADRAASRLTENDRIDRLSLALYALQFIGSSNSLDRRELFLVASVLRYAATCAGIDYEAALTDSLKQWMDGEFSRQLFDISHELPSIYTESIVDGKLVLDRRKSDIDMEALRQWLGMQDNEPK